MVAGNTCLNPETGDIIWTPPEFSASASPLFNSNVYSTEEKMFYIKANSYIQAWNFSNPQQQPKLVWETFVSGSGLVGSGIQYGAGKIFPGFFAAHQVALDAKTGAVLWDTNTMGAMIFSVFLMKVNSFEEEHMITGSTHLTRKTAEYYGLIIPVLKGDISVVVQRLPTAWFML